MSKKPHMRFGPFAFDSQSGDLRRRARKVHLQPQPLQLLRRLLTRPGELLTLDEIRQTLWPDKSFVDYEHGIGVAVKKLRDALGDDPVHPLYIETVRRRGYRFIAPVTFAVPVSLPARRIVGRDGQIEEINERWREVARRNRQVVFVSGEAGIGKTALVDEFVRRAVEDDSSIRVARGQCVEGYGVQEAYYPMLEALGSLLRAPGDDAFIDLLATLAPTWALQFPSLVKRQLRERLQSDVAAATQGRMLREIEEALEAITATTPLILIFEDLQWLDQPSVTLLSSLARHRSPARLLIIGTFRPAEFAAHPLQAVKQDLLIHQLARKIDLPALTAAEVGEYLAAEAPGVPVPEGLADAVYRHSEGNPLFMIAALEHMTLRGALSCDDGGWSIRQPLDEIALDVPENIREMIETQIDRLTAAEQNALEAASVQGVCFSSSVCAPAAGLEPAVFDDLCEGLARRRHMIRRAEARSYPNGALSATYEFVHALYREVFYQRQNAGARAILHQRVGLQLEKLLDDEVTVAAAEVADHFGRALDTERAIRYLRLAADNAVRRYAHVEAAAILESVLRLSSRVPEPERIHIEVEVLDRIGAIYVTVADVRAIATYETLCAKAAEAGLRSVQVRALTQLAFPLASVSATRAVEALKQALELCNTIGDDALRAATRASCYALLLSVGPRNPEYAEEFHRALLDIEAGGNDALHGAHRIDHSAVLFSASEYREAYRAATEGLAKLAARERDVSLDGAAWEGRVFASWTLIFLGEWGQALSEIESGMAEATKTSNDRRLQGLRLMKAWLHLLARDYHGALVVADSVVTQLSGADTPIGRAGRILVGAAETGLGNHDRALDVLLTVRDEMDRLPLLRDAYSRAALESSLCEIWLAAGDLARARQHAHAFLGVAKTTADRTWNALAWDMQARLAMAANDLERARACLNKAFDIISDFEVPLAAWRIDGTAAELYELEGETELADDHRERNRATVLRLANSLPADEPLQETFLSAPSIRKILTG